MTNHSEKKGTGILRSMFSSYKVFNPDAICLISVSQGYRNCLLVHLKKACHKFMLMHSATKLAWKNTIIKIKKNSEESTVHLKDPLFTAILIQRFVQRQVHE